MKSFKEFLKEIKTIHYIMAKPHKVFHKGKITNVGAGRAVPMNTSSGAGGDGGGGNGGE
jgi:hypothetical protein